MIHDTLRGLVGTLLSALGNICNHAKQVWACDFLTQYTAIFAVVQVFVVVEIGSRRVVHVNVTTNPTLAWVKQKIREATPSGEGPRFLVHDNDGMFSQFRAPLKVERNGKSRSYRCHLDCWLDQVIGVEGLPIPFGVPNASPYVVALPVLAGIQQDYRLAA